MRRGRGAVVRGRQHSVDADDGAAAAVGVAGVRTRVVMLLFRL